MAEITQTDFGGGIYRGRKAPANAVFDAINALVNDEGELFRRGGSTYKTTSDFGQAITGLWTGYLGAGQRTLAWGVNDLQVLDAAGTGFVRPGISSGTPGPARVRPAEIAGYGIFDNLGVQQVYAGSRKTSSFYLGTIGISGTTVTGSGTDWDPHADAGMILVIGDTIGIVESVSSDTSLTLKDPWPTTVSPGTGYALHPIYITPGHGTATAQAIVGNRLLTADGSRVYMTAPLSSSSGTGLFTADEEVFHQLPAGAQITGIEGLGDTAFVFTTAGVYAIANLSLDLFDDAGNVQQSVQRINGDVILWGELGLAPWQGGVIVPGTSDVYLMGADGSTEPVSEGIRPLYRGYVEAGYTPGTAAVFRGHYFLPVLDGTTLIDVLVCRLDRGGAWTRWDDHAAGGAYATQIGASSREPKLLGAAGQRVTDLTGCFDPDVARDDDADGTDHAFTVESSDVSLLSKGARRPGTAETVEAVYELASGSVALSWAAGEEGSSYTAASLIRGGSTSDGSTYSVWRVNKSRRSLRWKLVQTGATAKMILRSVTVRVRQSGH